MKKPDRYHTRIIALLCGIFMLVGCHGVDDGVTGGDAEIVGHDGGVGDDGNVGHDSDVTDSDASTIFTPHSMFTDLGDNTGVSLGAFACDGPTGGCARVTDYSGLTYDSRNHQLLMFGGGHASTMTDTVFAFDLNDTLQWSQLYEPTPCEYMNPDNLDTTLGAWLSGGTGPYPRPVSAHTYDFVAFYSAGNELVLLGRQFTYGDCSNISNDITGPVAHYRLDTNEWVFSADADSVAIQGRLSAGEYDPISGLFFTLGRNGLYTYDAATQTSELVQGELKSPDGSVFYVEPLSYANHMTYFPPTDTFYYFVRGDPVTTFALRPNRSNLAESTLEQVVTTGPTSNHQEPGYDYDSHNEIIGGGIVDNTFYAFDPVSAEWTASVIQGGSPGEVAYHALAYDPVNNIFVFVTKGRETWAYRYRN